MKKIISYILGIMFSCMIITFNSITAYATTVQDVINYARSLGMPEDEIQQYINQFGSGTYTSEQCDKAIELLRTSYVPPTTNNSGNYETEAVHETSVFITEKNNTTVNPENSENIITSDNPETTYESKEHTTVSENTATTSVSYTGTSSESTYEMTADTSISEETGIITSEITEYTENTTDAADIILYSVPVLFIAAGVSGLIYVFVKNRK